MSGFEENVQNLIFRLKMAKNLDFASRTNERTDERESFSSHRRCRETNKLHKKIAEISSPTGGIWPRLRSFFLQITMGKIKKALQAKIVVISTIFTPKIANKCKKMANQNPPLTKNPPILIKFGNPPAGGALA